MIELPEAITLAKQLNHEIAGKIVGQVYPPTNEHRFTWFHEGLETYEEKLKGRMVIGSQSFGVYVEIGFEDDYKLSFNDGINTRFLYPEDKRPVKYQLMIDFTDGCSLVFTVSMYGGFACFRGEFDNKYYIASKESISPLGDDFDFVYFKDLLSSVKPAMSMKAFLATEQRIPGLGNGILQDILFVSNIHPKRKVETLSVMEEEKLFQAVKEVLLQSANEGGRDTEKDLYGNPGGYRTLLSKKTYKNGCPCCDGEIEKQAFLGGAIYVCNHCQAL